MTVPAPIRKKQMDYCSTCRRHLNGALVCPGCGAYAPDIAPDIAPGVLGGHHVPGAATAHRAGPATAGDPTSRADRPVPPDVLLPAHPVAPAGADHQAPGAIPAAHAPHAPHAGEDIPSDDLPPMSGRPTGRAARRRQQDRWRKTQRRALIATAVALVGGGLTVASMERGAGDRAQATTAPDPSGMGGAHELTGPDTAPASPAPADTHRPGPDRPAQEPSDTDDLRRQGAADRASTATSNTAPDGAVSAPASTGTDPSATARRTAPQPSAPDTGSAPASSRAGTGTGAGAGSASGTAGSGSGGTAAGTGDDATGTGRGGGGTTDRDGTQATSPGPSAGSSSDASDSSTRLCLLVICLG
ncbi:SCO2400 family protein [Streptomyces sp. NPDC055058]